MKTLWCCMVVGVMVSASYLSSHAHERAIEVRGADTAVVIPICNSLNNETWPPFCPSKPGKSCINKYETIKPIASGGEANKRWENDYQMCVNMSTCYPAWKMKKTESVCTAPPVVVD